MKFKFLLLVLFVSISLISSAQIQKGTVMIGGDLSYSTQKTEYTNIKSHHLNVSPGIGKAVRQNLVVGVDFLFHHSSAVSITGNSQESETLGYGGGVFIRKYAVLAKNFYLYGQGRLGTLIMKDENPNQTSNLSSRSINVNVSAYPGVAYSVTPKLLLEAGFPALLYMSYSSGKVEGTVSDYKNRAFNVSTSISSGFPLSLGMRVLLNGN